MYKNLDLFFDRDENEGYNILAQNPVSNEKISRRFDLPFSWVEIDNFLKDLESLPELDRHKLEYFGNKLFDSVFSGDILGIYSGNMQTTDGEGIYLNLIFESGTEQLTRIPWELMFDGRNFVSCSTRTPLVRYIKGFEPTSFSEIVFPLRILFVVSKPLGSKPLNLGGQVRRIYKSLSKYIEEGSVEIHCLTGREFVKLDLIQSIKEGGYHILHISGHGEYDERLDRIFLLLEDGNNQRYKLSAGTLAAWVKDSKIRFVYLDACQTATTTKTRPAAWRELINSGIRGFIGMQFSITIERATNFSEVFYPQIINGKTVQSAVSYARNVIIDQRLDYNIVDWAKPVLYTTVHDILKVSGYKKPNKRYKKLDINQIFVGRDDYLDKITEDLIDVSTRIVLINGFGGIGKSALARELINDLRGHYDDICWIDPRKVKGFDRIISEINDMLIYHDIGIAEEKFQKHEPAEKIREITEELNKKKFLIVFDNFETIEDDNLILDFIREIDEKGYTSVLITKRIEKIIGGNQKSIQLLKLPEEYAFLLMRKLASNLGIQKIENAKDETLRGINSRVDGHPKAIELVIPHFKSLSLEIILKELPKVIGKDITPILEWTYEKLSETQKILLCKISIFPAETVYEELAAINQDVDIINEIKALVSSSLVDFDPNKNKYSLHTLIHEYAYAKLENKEKIHTQAYEYYLSIPIEKRIRKEDVQPLIEAYYHACMAKEYDKAASIIFDKSLDYDLDKWGNYRTLVELYRGVLPMNPLVDKPLLRIKKTHGIVLRGLGIAYCALGEVEKAIEYYKKALVIAQEIRDRRSEETWLADLGFAYWSLGHVEDAKEYYQRALAIAQEIGDRKGEGNSLGVLGSAYGSDRLEQVEKAIECYQKALDIAQEVEDRKGEGNWLENLGFAYLRLGKVDQAMEYFQKALDIAQEIRDRSGEEYRLGGLGQAYWSMGQEEKAIKYYRKALTIAQEIGDRRGEGTWLGNLGLAYADIGQVSKAKENYQKALVIAQDIKDKWGEGANLGNLGQAYWSLRQEERAIEYYRKALVIAQKFGDKNNEKRWLNDLCYVFKNKKKYKEALTCYLLSRKIRAQIKESKFKTTESNFIEELGEKEFEKLVTEVSPKIKEILNEIIDNDFEKN